MNSNILRKCDTVYCHFSFRRPKGKDYGLFSVAFYWDFEGKKCIVHETRKYPLWRDHQFISAIQAYENALYTIYVYQGQMYRNGINQVMLVTDNSTLAGWIEDPKKAKNYKHFMDRAVEKYRTGSAKEIILGIGLCDVRDYEKSYKYCKEEFVINKDTDAAIKITDSGINVIDINNSKLNCRTVEQIESESPTKVEIEGI